MTIKAIWIFSIRLGEPGINLKIKPLEFEGFRKQAKEIRRSVGYKL